MTAQQDISILVVHTGSITDAIDWEDLGRRIRRAAANAAELGIDPTDPRSHRSLEGKDQ